MRGFASDRLGIRRCMGGPLMLRGLKLKNGQVTPDGPKMVGSKLHPQIGPILGSLAHGPKMGVQVAPPPSGPMWGQLPIVGFWAPEGEWGWEIGKCGSPPTYFEWGNGKAHRMNFWEGLSQKKRVALRFAPSLAAARLAWMPLCCLVI